MDDAGNVGAVAALEDILRVGSKPNGVGQYGQLDLAGGGLAVDHHVVGVEGDLLRALLLTAPVSQRARKPAAASKADPEASKGGAAPPVKNGGPKKRKS